MADTFRTDIGAGLVAMVQAFMAANTSHGLQECLPVRPMAFNRPLPLAYISVRPEVITHTQGTRERVMAPSVVVVGDMLDSIESMARFDALVDACVDWFTGYAHITPGTIWDRMTVTDEREDVSDTQSLPAVRFTFENISKRVGRTALA